MEEAKRIEEILKIQLEEKEETIHNLEMEVVGLRKKGEKNESFFKFKNDLVVLDKIFNFRDLHSKKLVLVTRRTKKNMKMTLGLRRLQKQVHQCPKHMHLHMTTRNLEVQR